jgi:hypothetical protein
MPCSGPQPDAKEICRSIPTVLHLLEVYITPRSRRFGGVFAAQRADLAIEAAHSPGFAWEIGRLRPRGVGSGPFYFHFIMHLHICQ